MENTTETTGPWLVERKCTRCGIRFETALTWGMAFCEDCNYLDQTGVFKPLNPWWLMEGEE